jgi:hypothetical protein
MTVMDQPEPGSPVVPLRGAASPAPVSIRQRDFLLLTIFVLSQHGYMDRAGSLAEALYVLGDDSAEVMLARVILRFFAREWMPALTGLEELDRIDPIERFGRYTLTDRQRMRRYIKARCLYELRQTARARDAIESYLRHGAAGEDGTE